MNSPADLQQCLAFINCQLRPAGHPSIHPGDAPRWRAVTISRQAGSGGHVVAEMLALRLGGSSGGPAAPWMVFDRNLVTRVLEDHQLPDRLAEFMPEDRVSEIEDALDELLGVHPPVVQLVWKTAETILRLAELGNVIIIGRGANIVTARMRHVFHVRLIGSEARRAEFIQKTRVVNATAALHLMHEEDRGRRRYLKQHYHRDIDDPASYHLVINTDLTGHEAAARIIAEAMAQPQRAVPVAAVAA